MVSNPSLDHALSCVCPIRGEKCRFDCSFFVVTDVGGFAHREKRYGCAVALLPEFIKKFAGV